MQGGILATEGIAEPVQCLMQFWGGSSAWVLHIFCRSSEQRYQWLLFWTIEDASIVNTLGRLRDLHLGHRTGLFPEQNNKDNISP